MATESLNIIFRDQNQVEVQRGPVPEPKAGQLLVEARCSLISTGTELISLQRLFAPGTHWDQWIKYPVTPGYSMVGTVAAVGEGVEGFQPGERVAVRSGHRQYAVADASRAVKVPEHVSDEEAAWFYISCIVQNAVRRAAHELGDTVVVIGLGLLGQLVVQYMRLVGAREIIAIDLAPFRLELARAHGTTHVLPMSAAEAYAAVSALTDGRLADVVYDVTGHAPVFAAALPLARRLGKVILLGDTGTPSEQRLTSDVIRDGLHIIGAHASNPPTVSTDHAYWTHEHMARLFFTYLARGDMRVRDLITHRYLPTEAPAAYEMLRTDRSHALGVVFTWSQ